MIRQKKIAMECNYRPKTQLGHGEIIIFHMYLFPNTQYSTFRLPHWFTYIVKSIQLWHYKHLDPINKVRHYPI